MTVSQSQVSIENLVALIVREVIAELAKRGVVVGSTDPSAQISLAQQTGGVATLEIDMSAYKTPVLSESQLRRIDNVVSTIVVPCTTVVTPGAWGIIRSRKLKLVRKTQST